jgi:16S rRNA (uracil1498-N3)-methyltransferase
MSERFYFDFPLEGRGEVVLEGAEAHHLITVCRLRPGDGVCLFNGDGREYTARLVSADRRRATLEVIGHAAPPRELSFELEVAVPLPKGDRAQFLVEKLTELGATAFVPLATRRSVVHPRESRLEKLERYVIEASKQCGRNRLMRVLSLVEWERYGAASDPALRSVLAHPGGPENPREALTLGPGQRLRLAVGPEGGLAPEEVETAERAGWRLVDLGPRTLRVETAALTLAAWAVAANA